MNERLPLAKKKAFSQFKFKAEMYFSSFRDIQKDLRDFLSCRPGNYASLLRVKGIHRLGLLLSFKRTRLFSPVYKHLFENLFVAPSVSLIVCKTEQDGK